MRDPLQYVPSNRLCQLRLLVLAAAGAGAGYGAEMVHHWAGVWEYAGGHSGMPWWIAAVYAAGLYGAGWAFYLVERKTDFPLPWSLPTLALEGLVVVSFFLLSAALYPRELLWFGICTAFLAGRLLLFYRRGDWAVALGVAALDFGLESILAAIPLYHYTHAAYLKLPIWLVPFWATLGLSLRRLFRISYRDRSG